MSDNHDNQIQIETFPAQVRAATIASRDELLELAKARATDPSVFDAHEAFFWAAIISNSRVDSYWTHMDRSSLDNYARGASDGVSFQNSHRWNELPIGSSLTGRVEELQSGLLQVVADFYTLMGMQLNGLSTDQFVLGIRSGVVRDVSIGFSGGKRVCDVCGNNYLDYMRCSHYAGKTYEVDENGLVRQVLCTVRVADATLNEVSAVYDGATPGAVILKARSAAADGRLRGKEAEALEQMYRVALPVTRRFSGVDIETPEPQKEKRAMSVEAVLDEFKIGVGLEGDARAEALKAHIAKLVADGGELATVRGKLTTVEGELAEARETIGKLEPRAADGDTYREDLIQEALEEGVRAKGDKFEQKKFEPLLRDPSMTIERIKLMRDDWAADAAERLQGGRRTTDGHERGENQPNTQGKRTVDPTPAAAYRV